MKMALIEIPKKRLLYSIIFIVLFGGNCYESDKRDYIESCLNSPLPKSAREIKYYKSYFNIDYKKPYYVYIKFKLDSTEVQDFIKRIDLIYYDRNFIKSMCLENVDSLFVAGLQDFTSRNPLEKSPDFKRDQNWWDPYNKGLSLSGAFYREGKERKIEHCYLNKWDGRLLLGYEKNTANVYILIEVFL
jgi:hypothetical protein